MGEGEHDRSQKHENGPKTQLLFESLRDPDFQTIIRYGQMSFARETLIAKLQLKSEQDPESALNQTLLLAAKGTIPEGILPLDLVALCQAAPEVVSQLDRLPADKQPGGPYQWPNTMPAIRQNINTSRNAEISEEELAEIKGRAEEYLRRRPTHFHGQTTPSSFKEAQNNAKVFFTQLGLRLPTSLDYPDGAVGEEDIYDTNSSDGWSEFYVRTQDPQALLTFIRSPNPTPATKARMGFFKSRWGPSGRRGSMDPAVRIAVHHQEQLSNATEEVVVFQNKLYKSGRSPRYSILEINLVNPGPAKDQRGNMLTVTVILDTTGRCPQDQEYLNLIQLLGTHPEQILDILYKMYPKVFAYTYRGETLNYINPTHPTATFGEVELDIPELQT
jgi:hypothetical protein